MGLFKVIRRIVLGKPLTRVEKSRVGLEARDSSGRFAGPVDPGVDGLRRRTR